MKRQGSGEQLLYLLKTEGPCTAAQLGQRLAMTSMGARRHLQRLEERGLVASADQAEQVGRPRRYWHLTEKAQQRFPDRHADLTLSILEAVRREFGEPGLDRLIRARERELEKNYNRTLSAGADLKARVALLAGLRNAEGYMAEVLESPDGSLLFIENHCPICAAAETCRNLCRSELALFRRCLGVPVVRINYILDGDRRCAYRIAEPLSV